LLAVVLAACGGDAAEVWPSDNRRLARLLAERVEPVTT
jgi:hypothetical protein